MQITKNTGNPVNQSKLETNTCSRCEVREKKSVQMSSTKGNANNCRYNPANIFARVRMVQASHGTD